MQRLVPAFAVFLVLARALFAQGPAPAQAPPVFRSETRLVPVDIRVVDQKGKPVTNLTPADFTVLEDGVRQDIREFATHVFTPDPAAASDDAGLPTFRAPGATLAANALAPANRRVFLVVFGRADVQSIGKGLDGVVSFVRRAVLPQDLVGVLAWNRATPFLTGHDQIATLVERLEGGYRDVEKKLTVRDDMICRFVLEFPTGTLRPSDMERRIAPAVQATVDAVFGAAAGAGTVRTIIPARNADAGEMADIAAQWNGWITETAAATAAGISTAEESSALDACITELQTLDDLGNLYAAIDYLRHLDGEKHLVFVSDVGLSLARREDDHNLAAAAATERVAIDYIHTGGQGRGSDQGISKPMEVAGYPTGLEPRTGTSQMPWFAEQTARTLATLTGGTSYWNRLDTAADDLATLDAVTRFQYVLGYYSSSPANGRFRNIEVRVNRPGLTLMYRRGYYATPQLVPVDRQRLLTNSRISVAATAPQPIRDIPMQATASSSARTGQTLAVKTEVSVPANALRFERDSDRNKASVVVAVWYLGKDDALIRQAWGEMDLVFSDEQLRNLASTGVPISLAATVTSPVTSVKIVLYQYAADRVGSAVARVQ